MTISRARAILLSVAIVLWIERPAFAQAEDQAAARVLFVEGRRLRDAGQLSEACTKFEAARRIYTSAGILLNLADCYEKTGRTASAWTTFVEAGSVATRTKRSEEAAEAKRRQTKLEPQLTRVSLHLNGETAGLTIKRDDAEVPAAAWDAPIPVDPGKHEFRAEASGFSPWVESVNVSEPGKTVTIDVPPLVALPVAHSNPAPPVAMHLQGASAETESPKTASAGPAQRAIGLTIAGAGVLGMGVSGVMSIIAKLQFDRATGESGPAKVSDSTNASHLADAATVVVVAGAVVAAAGAVIWLTAPKAQVSVGTNGQALFVTGRF